MDCSSLSGVFWWVLLPPISPGCDCWRASLTSFSLSLTLRRSCFTLVFSPSSSAVSSRFFLERSTILVAAVSLANPPPWKMKSTMNFHSSDFVDGSLRHSSQNCLKTILAVSSLSVVPSWAQFHRAASTQKVAKQTYQQAYQPKYSVTCTSCGWYPAHFC